MSILWRTLLLARPYYRWTVLAFLCLMGATGFNLLVPYLIRQVVDRGLLGRDPQFLLFAAVSMIVIYVLRGSFQFAQSFLNQYVSQRVAFDLRQMLYEHLQQLSFAYHDRAQTGDLIARTTSDVNYVRIFTGQDLISLARTILLYFGVSYLMFRMHPTLALLSLATMPFLGVTAFLYGTRVRSMYRQMQRQFAAVTAGLEQSITGIRVVKAFAREPYEIERFERENEQFLHWSVTALRLRALVRPLMLFIATIGTIFILWYGGQETINDRLTLGMLLAFNAYLLQLAQPTRQLGMLIDRVSRVTASAERVFEILDAPSPVQQRPHAVDPGRLRGHVTFDQVAFGYAPHRPVLHDISLEALPNQVVALVGPTGAGKTSLVSLIPRFYDVAAGVVRVDGHDVRDLVLPALRRQIGIVMQQSLLFSASVAENIAYGRPDASLADIERAAQAAQAHDFIAELPEGYDTEIGERGVTLSGGQQQRVAIARALVMNPPILILDDATASVDMQTEYLIHQALHEVMRGRTTFMIAQRVSTVQHADQIIVIEAGRIVEHGRHEELVAQPGAYRAIYDAQVGEQVTARASRAAATPVGAATE